jgi:hypothetical protein
MSDDNKILKMRSALYSYMQWKERPDLRSVVHSYPISLDEIAVIEKKFRQKGVYDAYLSALLEKCRAEDGSVDIKKAVSAPADLRARMIYAIILRTEKDK